MKLSAYSIFSPIKDSENHLLVNLLSGNADILSANEAAAYQQLEQKGIATDDFKNELAENGYWVDEQEEAKRYQNKYLDFIDNRENDEVQLFFVPNYACNFACSYCYQDEYTNPNQFATNDLVDAFFAYIQKEFANRKKYITVFGGEPLLPGQKQRELIAYLLQKANDAAIDVCFVTNGYTLIDYVDLLKISRIREVQITLDGTEKVHNARRILKGGGDSFNRIVEGINACLSNNITVNLRMVLDKENIVDLPALANFAIEKGWTNSPYFKTQIGRNYELHHCQSAASKLYSRIEMYQELYSLIKQHPHILTFYKPAYSISKFLSENGELPDPLFDSCPACKTEWAFDYTGHIFPCTATVGKKDESLGTFYPEIKLNSQAVEPWEERDVTAIPECKTCSMQLACGGGCGSVAKNKNGSVCSPDCRPVKELLELGFGAYLTKS